MTIARRIVDKLVDALYDIERELNAIDFEEFPRVRIVFEFEFPDRVALEIRKRRSWK